MYIIVGLDFFKRYYFLILLFSTILNRRFDLWCVKILGVNIKILIFDFKYKKFILYLIIFGDFSYISR